jgi:hypothetical protein
LGGPGPPFWRIGGGGAVAPLAPPGSYSTEELLYEKFI